MVRADAFVRARMRTTCAGTAAVRHTALPGACKREILLVEPVSSPIVHENKTLGVSWTGLHNVCSSYCIGCKKAHLYVTYNLEGGAPAVLAFQVRCQGAQLPVLDQENHGGSL